MKSTLRHFLTGLAFCLPTLTSAQQSLPDTAGLSHRLEKHVTYLASDKLGGRLTGSKYEQAAAKYLVDHFKSCGLQPVPASGWQQEFSFYTGYSYGKNNSLKIGNSSLKLDEDWYPVAYSADGTSKGTIRYIGSGLDSSKIGNNTGEIFLINLAIPEPAHPHDKVPDWQERLDKLKKYKPQAVIFANSPQNMDIYAYKRYHNLNRESIPLVNLNSLAIPKEGLQALDGKAIVINTQLQRKRDYRP